MVQITLYHYTSVKVGKGIQKKKIIKQSTEDTPSYRRLHGKGVYFTSLDPYHDTEKLVLNCFTKGGQQLRSRKLFEKIHYVVRVTFERNEVEKIQDGDRDIYLYKGDVDLKRYSHEVKPNPNYSP